MRCNRFLTSTFLTGTLLVLTLSAGIAQAAESQAMTPQGKWALTKVDRVATNGNSYCTLSHQYGDNVILSLGRNLAEEYSLAVDFQKPVFTKGESIKVGLQPGPGQNRAYDLMPASEKAMVIRLGWDSAFFKTLNQTQTLKVSINDKSYDFKLPDIARGQDDLKGCMEELKVAAQGGAAAQKTAAAPTKDVLAAQPETATSSGFNAEKADASKPAAEKVAATKSPEKAAVAAQAATVAKAEKMDQALTAQNAQLERDLKQALAKSQSLEAQLISVQKSMADTKAMEDRIAALQSDLAAKEAETKSLRETAAKTKATGDIMAQQSAELDQLRAQNKLLNEKIITFEKTATQAQTSQQQVQTLQQKLSQLEADMAAKQQAITAYEQAKAQGDSSAKAMLAQKDQEIAKIQADKALLQSKVEAQAKALSDKSADMTLAQKDQEISKILAEKEALQLKIDEQAAQILAASNKPATPVVSESEKSAMATLAEKSAEFEAMKIENNALNAQIADLQKQLGEAKASQTTAAAMPSEALKSAQDKVTQLEIKNKQLEDMLRQSQTRIAEAAVSTESKSIRKIADLEAKLTAAQNDNATLARQLEGVKLQQEDKRLTMIAGDWDLEKATKRFNEAEREIQRLGLELERERTSCNMEKSKIEQMLFDPAVTEEKQLERLNALEQENAALKSRLNIAQGGEPIAPPSVVRAVPQVSSYVPSTPMLGMDSPSVADINPAAGVSIAGGSIIRQAAVETPAQTQSSPAQALLINILSKAGVSTQSLAKTPQGIVGAENFTWSTGTNGLQGFAALKPINPADFKGAVDDYIAFQKTRCGGDFASAPSPSVTAAAGKNVAMYEIACMAPSDSRSASVLFFEQGGQFVAISNQSSDPAQIGAAMDARDNMAGAISGL